MPKPKLKPAAKTGPAYRLRNSTVHGKGLFATRTIRKGAHIIEYAGERISHKEADRRHSKKKHGDNHTFLFTIDEKVVVDGDVNGNEARFINHSCDPNCEVVIDDGRLMISAIRTIHEGDELGYEYMIGRSDDDDPELEKIFACRCGSPKCKGTMLEPKKKKKKAASKKSAPAKSKAKAKAKAKAKVKTKTKTKAKRTVSKRKSAR